MVIVNDTADRWERRSSGAHWSYPCKFSRGRFSWTVLWRLGGACCVPRGGPLALSGRLFSATVPPGTLRRARMPSAVWQGFCNLLRAPPLPGRVHLHGSPPLPGALSAPRHVPGALQGVPNPQDGLQDGPGRPPKPPRWPKMPPRRPKRPQRSPKSAPRGPPRGPNDAKINDFGLFGPCWRLPWSPLGSSWRPLGRS